MQLLYNTQEEGGKSIPTRIREHWGRKKDFYIRFIECALIAVIFFGLGMVYAWDIAEKRAPIRVIEPLAGETAALAVGALPAQIPPKKTILTGQKGEYVASKNGTKYYPKGCANRIKEENKIYFTTPENAEKAGFSLAKNCLR